MRPGVLPRYMKATKDRHRAYLQAIERWGQMMGWCKAMLWTYEIYGWNRVSQKALRSLIKKLEFHRPRAGSTVTVIRRPTEQQAAFLRWSCEYFGFDYKED